MPGSSRSAGFSSACQDVPLSGCRVSDVLASERYPRAVGFQRLLGWSAEEPSAFAARPRISLSIKIKIKKSLPLAAVV